jgi:hypothetical protein
MLENKFANSHYMLQKSKDKPNLTTKTAKNSSNTNVKRELITRCNHNNFSDTKNDFKINKPVM